jgi:signal transduction histidine kinase
MKKPTSETKKAGGIRPSSRKTRNQGASPVMLIIADGIRRRAEWVRPWETAGWKVETSSTQKAQSAWLRHARSEVASPEATQESRPQPLLQMEKWQQALREMLELAMQSAPSLRSTAVLLREPDTAGFRCIAAQGLRGCKSPDFIRDEDSAFLRYLLAKQKAVSIPDGFLPLAVSGKTKLAQRHIFIPVRTGEQVAVLRFDHAGQHMFGASECIALRQTVKGFEAYLEKADLQARLMSSELRYRSILSTAPFLIALLDAKGIVREINPQLVQELKRQGISPKHAIGTNVITNEALPEDLRGLLGASLKSSEGFSREEINVSLPRGPEVMRLHVVPLRNGYSTGELLVIAEIITHYHQLMDEAERTERLAAIGRVAASLAHEVNNPLQALRSHLELIRSYPLSDEEREQSFGILEREVERLDETTRRVLGFARPAPDILQPASIAGMLEQTLALSRNYLQHQKINIHTDFEAGLAPVQAAPGQLIQVFLNIVLNAAHAMQGCGTLDVRTRAQGEMVEVVFSNDGPPIPADHLPHIFEPFYTTHPEGTGLGLSISHAILQRHHGTIRAENLPRRRGVAFTITLPFAEEGTHIE